MEGLRVSAFAGAEQAAEKGPFEGEIRPRVLQGLKPDIDSIGFIGTTEVVPFQNQALNRVFSQPVKPRGDLRGFVGATETLGETPEVESRFAKTSLGGENRPRKRAVVAWKPRKTIPQGLKPNRFYWLYWHG
jgi:hypothetical protein